MATAEAKMAAVAATKPTMVAHHPPNLASFYQSYFGPDALYFDQHVHHLRSDAFYFDSHVRQFRADSREAVL